MKDLISLKAVALFVSMFACSFTFSGCSDKDSDTIQAEVVFADGVNLTKITPFCPLFVPFCHGSRKHRRLC